MSPEEFKGVAGVVVHHNRPDVIGRTVAGLIREGIAPENLVLVDNSDGDVLQELDVLGKDDVIVKRIPNQGYANAVNYGLDFIFGGSERPELVIVVTHEVSLAEGTLRLLVETLRTHEALAAVGPILKSTPRKGPARTASGGIRSRFFGIPIHNREIPSGGTPVVERAWLDGAIVVYRGSALEHRRMREEFFLYCEETEFHFRLAEEFGPIACVSTAMAFEEANDPPPRLLGRNLQWLFDLHGNHVQRAISVPYVIFRNFVKVALRRQTLSGVRELYLGWREARALPLQGRTDQSSGAP